MFKSNGGFHPSQDFVPGELIVRLRSSSSVRRVNEVFAVQGMSVLNADARASLYLLRVEQGQEMATALALQQDEDVVYAHPNYVLSVAQSLTCLADITALSQ